MSISTGPSRHAIAAAFAAALVLTACAPDRDNNGNIPLAEVVEKIEAGKQNREDVVRALGSPSVRGTFQKDQVWYYIGKRTETQAFLEPKVLEHRVIEIHFDNGGVVKEVKHHDATQAAEIDFVKRTTPTKGNELTIIEQLIGNLGRFTPSTGESPSGP